MEEWINEPFRRETQLAMSSLPRPSATGREGGTTNRISLGGKQGIVQLIWRQHLLDQVRTYVGETYVSRGGRGQESGGVIFGQRLGELVHVLAWRPMPKDSDSTSHFYLNEREEQSLRKLIQSAKSDSGLKGMEVLGWFRSKVKGEANLDGSDISFHEKFFPGISQFVMVIKPSHQRPAQAAIFIREDGGQFAATLPTATLTLQPGAMEQGGSGAAQGQLPEVRIDRAARMFSREIPWKRISLLGALALLSIALTVAAMQWNVNLSRQTKTTPAFKLNAELDGDEIKVMWDPASPALSKAGGARLEWQGEQIQLTSTDLQQGYRRLPLNAASGNDLVISVISLNAGNINESAHFIASLRKF